MRQTVWGWAMVGSALPAELTKNVVSAALGLSYENQWSVNEYARMQKDDVISELEQFKARLAGEVANAYAERGSSFGQERFDAWRRKITAFLSEHLPSKVTPLNEKLTHFGSSRGYDESDLEVFSREDGEPMVSFIDSLILDVRNDEFDLAAPRTMPTKSKKKVPTDKTKVFIVHGHDGEAKQRTARFVEKLGFKAVILHEQPSRGKTIIEKIEEFSDVGFAIVLYTPDDLGNVKDDAEKNKLRPRARQNVVFEHGFLISKIGRENVVPLVSGDIELPNDISGMVYLSDDQWQVDIAKEMKAAGYSVDFNAIL